MQISICYCGVSWLGIFLKDKKVTQCQLSMSIGLNEACDKCVAAWAGATLELQVLCLLPSMFKASYLVFSLEKSKTEPCTEGHPATREEAVRLHDCHSPFLVGSLVLEKALGSQEEPGLLWVLTMVYPYC